MRLPVPTSAGRQPQRALTPGPGPGVLALMLLLWGAGQAQAQDRWWERGRGGIEPAPVELEPEEVDPAEPPEPPLADDGDPDALDDAPPGEAAAPLDLPPEPGGLHPASDTVPSAVPVWQWQHVLNSPRIGGRFTAVAVDPFRPNRIFVGTDEGTMLRSLDGGTTWREIEMWPVVPTLRAVRPVTPGLPNLGEATRLGLDTFSDPPFRATPPDRISVSVPNLWNSLRPEFVWIGFTPSMSGAANRLLADSIRQHMTIPVRRIIICPGASYPLVAATREDVLGSTDEGLTWVRLIRLPNITVKQVACSRLDPNKMMAATGFGMFMSFDGGMSWDQSMSGWPGQKTTAVSYGAAPGGVGEQSYVATGDVLYTGIPESDEGLTYNYPDFNNSETAPWHTIRWIEAEGTRVWLATDDGVRMSRDGGGNWEVVARTLLSRHKVWQVAAGANEHGGTRIAALIRDCPLNVLTCRGSHVYASDDGGLTWHPFFTGATRRNLYQMATAPPIPGQPPRWWVISAGELWATVPGELRDMPGVDWDAAVWAREKLRRTIPVRQAIEDALEGTYLSVPAMNDFFARARDRNWIPIINAQVGYQRTEHGRFEERELFQPRNNFEDYEREEIWAWVNFTWWLRDTPMVTEQLHPVYTDIYQLRRLIAFFAEDTWHERKLHLRRIAIGMTDRLQIEVLKERIAMLETILDVWMRHPVEREPRRGRGDRDEN